MPRMTRARVKQEPVHERSDDLSYCPSTDTQPISLNSTPTPDRNSGDTTIPDSNTAMNGTTDMDGSDASQANASTFKDTQDVLVQMGASSKHLIEAIRKLEKMSLDTTLPSLPLPKFVAVGDQSVGKSSVIEAICNIALPRNEGTTTRCPFLITTSATNHGADHAHDWTCVVSLEHHYSYNPDALGPERDFQQWDQRPTAEVVPFATLHNKSDLKAMLKRAQMAILNPRQNPNSFLNAPLYRLHVMQNQVPFSPNVVSLRVESAGLPELSFYDLPGLIAIHDRPDDTDEESQLVVDFIEELARHYVNKPHTLVLFACSASQDFETNLALRLIKKAKASARSIGVVTKPDLLRATDFEKSQLQALLRGEKIQLKGGWFVTKQLSRTEVEQGTTYEQARDSEKAFFSQLPWSTSPFSERFGIPALQSCIATQLRGHIIAHIPEIRRVVSGRHTTVTNLLANFPEQDEHPVATVSVEIQRLANTIQQSLSDRGKKDFRTPYKQAFSNFGKSLKDCAPLIKLATPADPTPVYSLISDDEVQTVDPTPAMRCFGTPSKRAVSSRPQSQIPSSSKRMKMELDAVPSPPIPCFTLDFVKEEYLSGCASGIPRERQPEVTDSLSLAAIKNWDPLVADLLKDVESVIQRFLAQRISASIAARRHTKLYASVSQITNNLIRETVRQRGSVISLLLSSEQHVTYSSDDLKHQREEIMGRLQTARTKIRLDEYFKSKEKGKPDEDRKAEIKALVTTRMTDTKWQAANLPKDTWHEWVEALVPLIAYYQLASRRFQENVYLCLEVGLVHQISCSLGPTLRAELGANNVERCRELITEHPDRERKRQELIAEQRKLEAAIEELSALTDVEMSDA